MRVLIYYSNNDVRLAGRRSQVLRSLFRVRLSAPAECLTTLKLMATGAVPVSESVTRRLSMVHG